MALLGDAAHAVTPDLGQGAGQALEDAATLSALLTVKVDLGAALTAYDQQRRPRTQELVRASAKFGRLAQWQHPVAAALRDTLAALLPASAYLNVSAETLSWAHRARHETGPTEISPPAGAPSLASPYRHRADAWTLRRTRAEHCWR